MMFYKGMGSTLRYELNYAISGFVWMPTNYAQFLQEVGKQVGYKKNEINFQRTFTRF